MTFFVLSVFPAPDSPVINMDWFSRSSPMFTQARSAIAKICGGLELELGCDGEAEAEDFGEER